MSVVNRVIVVIIALVVFAGAVINLLVATDVYGADVLPYGWFESQLESTADSSGGTAAAHIAISVLITLGMVVLLAFEFVTPRRPLLLLISSTEEGIATIERESVCELAEKTASTIRAVSDIKCSVRRKAAGLAISCCPVLTLGSNIPEVSAELQNKIKEAVEQLTGLPVAEVDIKAKYERAEARRLAVR